MHKNEGVNFYAIFEKFFRGAFSTTFFESSDFILAYEGTTDSIPPAVCVKLCDGFISSNRAKSGQNSESGQSK